MDAGDYWQGLLAFVRSAETSSFTAAARELKLTPSAVGRAVTRLEQRLGVTLFKRSTRALFLTVEGRDFLEQVRPALEMLRDAERAFRHERVATGVVRVSASIDLGRTLLARWAAALARSYPALVLELDVTDRLVDLRRDGVDIAVRLGSLPPVGVAGERVGTIGYAVVASPGYLKERGTPADVADLCAHNCLQYLTNDGMPLRWTLDGSEIATAGAFVTGDGGALRAAALAGGGIGYLLRFAVEDDLREGALVEVLPSVAKAKLPVSLSHAFGEQPPARVRVVLAFLRERLVLSA